MDPTCHPLLFFSFFPLHLIFFLQLAAAAPRAPRDGPPPPRAPGSASAPPRPWWRPEVRTALPAPRVCLRPAPSSSPRARAARGSPTSTRPAATPASAPCSTAAARLGPPRPRRCSARPAAPRAAAPPSAPSSPVPPARCSPRPRPCSSPRAASPARRSPTAPRRLAPRGLAPSETDARRRRSGSGWSARFVRTTPTRIYAAYTSLGLNPTRMNLKPNTGPTGSNPSQPSWTLQPNTALDTTEVDPHTS